MKLALFKAFISRKKEKKQTCVSRCHKDLKKYLNIWS